ncbi:hypothetical protein ACOI1C_05705 [Bacillus sp. DJP31]|uniref:hypothetical protein n=1 Tax=Bacillus sp. DJP31 TaxID=3409789 RepID=UPI003BB60E63
MTTSFDLLLKSFQQLWNNRSIEMNIDSLSIIQKTIIMDLKDELSHPRARSTPQKKFDLAVKRILTSSISGEDQQQIIRLYEEELARLNPK